MQERYVSALCEEIKRFAQDRTFPRFKIEAIYVGGVHSRVVGWLLPVAQPSSAPGELPFGPGAPFVPACN